MALFFSNADITEEESEFDLLPTETTQVKRGLKNKIRLKCLEKGTEIPKIEEKAKVEPPKPKIKEEDPEVIQKRRERNKIAAMKCRRLKRERVEKLDKKRNNWEEKNRKVRQEKERLRNELLFLRQCLRNHRCKLPPTSQAGVPAFNTGISTGIPHWQQPFML